MKPMADIQTDFDRLAQFSGEDHVWDHNNHYHGYLLKHVPQRCDEALEIGCGTGMFSRALAKKAKHVTAIDLSPEMIRRAKERSTGARNIDFEVKDVLHWDLPDAHFDCIASIATLHHLAMEDILSKIKRALKPNGVLLVVDLLQETGGIGMYARGAIAIAMSAALKLIKNGRAQNSAEEQAAWEAHGKDDHYLTIPELQRICDDVLPGAQLKQHLLWRYSLVWKKP